MKNKLRKSTHWAIPRVFWSSAILCVSQAQTAEKFQKNGKNFPKTVLTPQGIVFMHGFITATAENGG